jgi:hypothetical protein
MKVMQAQRLGDISILARLLASVASVTQALVRDDIHSSLQKDRRPAPLDNRNARYRASRA